MRLWISKVSGALGRRRSWIGLLLLLAATLPFQIWRARLEGSWWVDESESVLLASGPVARIFDYCASDTNPPGYFLALKPWLALGRVLPGGPGALWARGPEILAWTLLLIFLWRRGRTLFGPSAGTALAWAVASSVYAGWFVEARGFGISSAASLACGLLLWSLIRDAAAEPSRRRRWKPWLAYVLLAEVALWNHLLSAVLLGLLAAVWLAAALRLRVRAPWLLREGAMAHGLVALAFSPWLAYLGNQMATRRNEDSWWVTNATLKQWLLVFFQWYPFGEAELPRWLWLPLGILTLLAPVAAAVIAIRMRRSGPILPDLLGLGAAALALSLLFTSILWGLQRFFGLTVFHGPRYPGLATGFWAAGLALLSAGAVSRAGWRPALVWLPLAPWLLAGWIGQHGESIDDRGTVFERHKELAFLPPRGATLFVSPASLYPFVRHSLAGWQARPAADLPCAIARAQPGEDAWLLDLNFLHMLDEPEDTLVIAEAGGSALSRDISIHQMVPPQHYTLYHLSGVSPRRARWICGEGGLRPAAPPIPGQAAAVALPDLQRLRDGWWWFDADASGGYRRWWTRPRVPLRFDRPVGLGDYVLHYRGFCLQRDAEPHDLHLHLDGSSFDLHLFHREGEVTVDAPVHLAAPLRAPVLWLEHPMRRPKRLGLQDVPVLQMGSQLRYAWLESVRSESPMILAGTAKRRR
jgi:hypothetical protein